MISEEMKRVIRQLMHTERSWALKQHGHFHSMHEGYAVALEEFDETADEFRKLEEGIPELWEMVKDDATPFTYLRKLDELRETTVQAIAELCQLGAMLEKMDDFLRYSDADSHKSAKDALDDIGKAVEVLGKKPRRFCK